MKLYAYYLSTENGEIIGPPFRLLDEAKRAPSPAARAVVQVVAMKKVTTEWKE